jgi:hypothetical protein
MTLSNRDKSRHETKRGIDSKGVRHGRDQDHCADGLEDD